MLPTNGCESCPAASECECVWVCGRGRTRLSCHVRRADGNGFELQILRNTRVYAVYRFVERVAAVTFAARFKYLFEGNGWTPA